MPIDTKQLKKAHELLAEGRALQATFTPEPTTDDALVLVILNGIPIFNSLLKKLNATTSGISKLIKKTGDSPMTVLDALKVNPFVGIALNVLDFIQIPLLYFTAFALGKDAPITLSNNGRWLYAAVLLALCLTAFLLPVTAPFIAVSSASLGFLASVFVLSKLLHEYHEDKKALKEVMKQISTGPAGNLQDRITALDIACLNPDKNIELINGLMDEIQFLKHYCETQMTGIKTLHKDAYILGEKLKIEADVMDSCIGIALSSLAVCGTVVSLFFPPVGLIMLFTAAACGAAYVAARLIAPHFMGLQNQPAMTKDKGIFETDIQPKESIQETTANLFSQLGCKKKSFSSSNIAEEENGASPNSEGESVVNVPSIEKTNNNSSLEP